MGQAKPITHALLVKKAATWLRQIGCKVILVEHHGAFGREHPDVIGWRADMYGLPKSYLVECKISRSDFTADLKKKSRASYSVRPAWRCYYLTPRNLLMSSTLPLRPQGWGLLELDAPHRAVLWTAEPSRPAGLDDRTEDRTANQLLVEMSHLYFDLHRYQAQGVRYKTSRELFGRECQLHPGEFFYGDQECKPCRAIAVERSKRNIIGLTDPDDPVEPGGWGGGDDGATQAEGGHHEVRAEGAGERRRDT